MTTTTCQSGPRVQDRVGDRVAAVILYVVYILYLDLLNEYYFIVQLTPVLNFRVGVA